MMMETLMYFEGEYRVMIQHLNLYCDKYECQMQLRFNKLFQKFQTSQVPHLLDINNWLVICTGYLYQDSFKP